MKANLIIFFCIASTFSPYYVHAKTYNVNTQQKLCFIENNGQIKDQFSNPRKDIQYTLQGQGVTIFIGDGQLHYQFSNSTFCQSHNNAQLNQITGNKYSPEIINNHSATIETYRIDVELISANKNATVIAEEEEAYYENYYLPGCPANGLQAHSYKKITYKNVFPDIDWVFNIKGETLEYAFVVKPGGDISEIKLKYKGQTSLKINDGDGSITAATPMGIIKEMAPVCFKPDGSRVASSFKLRKNILSYDVNKYTGELVIDPVLEWGTYYGADTSTTYFYGIACDDWANVYACGGTYTSNIGTIATTGSFQNIYEGNEDGFLVKFDSSGNRLWGTYYGGSQLDWASAVTCDHSGNVYIAGSTASDSGIATPGTQEPTYIGGQWDAFLAKFNAAGIRQWGTYVGGTNAPFFDIEVASVICDALGHVYVSGACDDTDHIATPGCFKYIKTEGVDRYDCYLQQYDTTGMRLWGTYYGGDKNDITGVLCTDGNYVYLSGYTWSDTGIASLGSYQHALYNSNSDAFIAKFAPSGYRVWGTYYGGEAGETTGGITLSNGFLYLLGSTSSDTSMATTGCFQPIRGGSTDAFLAKFEPESGYRQWGTYYGGSGDEVTTYSRITGDDTGNLYIVGYTNSSSGIASPGAWKTNYSGSVSNAFIAKFDDSGMRKWSTYYGGNNEDRAIACAFDGKGLYVCGVTNSTDSIATPGSFLSSGGGLTYYYQGFLAKFIDPYPVLSTTEITPVNDKIVICPNPVSTELTISTNDKMTTIVITNFLGQTVYSRLCNNDVVQLDVTTLPPGAYFVHINGTQVKKFIKE